MASMDPETLGRMPEIVRDALLPTKLSAGHVVTHPVWDRVNATNLRKLQDQTWVRTRELGRGAFDSTWLETCTGGKQKGQVRAVRVITSRDLSPTGLQAIMKFSQDKVLPSHNTMLFPSGHYKVAFCACISDT